MSADLHVAARCFTAYIEDACVGFISYVHFPHPKKKDIKMVHRLVVLPDFQGLGIGGKLLNWLGELLSSQGFRLFLNTTHPATIGFGAKSPRWQLQRSGRASTSGKTADKKLASRQNTLSACRNSCSFCYVPTSRQT